MMPLILEGLVTTLNEDGSTNISPMGPLVNEEQTEFVFRPFQTSRTYRNMKRDRVGVFHVVDDVLLLAKAAIGQLEVMPSTQPAVALPGVVLQDACRWFEFEVADLDDASERTTIKTRVLHAGKIREFWGLNRAKHAVLELAVMATRLFMLEQSEIAREVERLAIIVEKTAGEQETAAFELLREYIANYDDSSDHKK